MDFLLFWFSDLILSCVWVIRVFVLCWLLVLLFWLLRCGLVWVTFGLFWFVAICLDACFANLVVSVLAMRGLCICVYSAVMMFSCWFPGVAWCVWEFWVCGLGVLQRDVGLRVCVFC